MVSETKRRDVLIVGCVAGLLLGLALPFTMIFSLYIFLVPVLLAALAVWAGPIPAGVAVASNLVVAYLIGVGLEANGLAMAGSVLALFLLPPLLSVWMIRRPTPFFKGMGKAVAIQMLLIVVVIAALYLHFRGNLIDVFLVWFRGAINQSSAQLMNQLLLALGRAGLFGNDLGINFGVAFLSAGDRVLLIERYMQMLKESLQYTLPGSLLIASALTGGVGYMWGTWIAVRRGDDPTPDYKPLSEWRLPTHMIVGLPALTLCGLILYQMNVAGAEVIYQIFLQVMFLAFSVQALGALSRRMKSYGMPRGSRFLWLTLAFLFAQFFLRIIGIYSALFGSKGLISGFVKKHSDDGEGDDR